MPDTIPISGPAAWVGKEVTQREDWNFTLASKHLEEIRLAVRQTATMPLTGIGSAEFSLPILGQQLLQIQHQLEHQSGVTILKGLPVDDFSAEEAERIFWGLSTYIGTAVSQSASGERIFHVRDEGFKLSLIHI